MPRVHIAVVGCSHGEVDKIYEVIADIEKKRSIKVSLVLCCGDFQSVRNMTDLRCMACPIKYQAMHDFYRYYSGEKKAPVPTLFIGGNHEASNFLQELPFGGWVAPNIYYCGYASVVKFGSLRIAGISGIYKGHDYLRGRFECPPYDNSTMRSVYHYRNLDIFRMKQIKGPVDIALSHDWPKGIHFHGNTEQLLRRKPFFRQEIEKNELGSRPLFELLTKLQPSYWFSAHLHVKFPAIMSFNDSTTSQTPDETESGSEEKNGDEQMPADREIKNETGIGASPKGNSTHFLALDKVLPHRQFLQILELPFEDDPEEAKLSYDPEWLAILKSTDHLLSTRNSPCYMPNATGDGSRFDYSPTPEELTEIKELFQESLVIPENFTRTGPLYEEGQQPQRAFPIVNPQTTRLCTKLEIRDPLRLVDPGVSGPAPRRGAEESPSYNSQLDITYNEDSYSQLSLNPAEISLDNEEEEEDEENEGSSSALCGRTIETPKRGGMSSPLVTSAGGRRSSSKLVLPPPKQLVGDESEETADDGGEGGGLEQEAKGRRSSGDTRGGGGRSDLEILRSVMGPSFGLEEPAAPGASTTTRSRDPAEPEALSETGVSFVLDRKGEPENKRRRNERIYNEIEEAEEEGADQL